jgi:hypothetical protein
LGEDAPDACGKVDKFSVHCGFLFGWFSATAVYHSNKRRSVRNA